jgi:hypothetical protein
VSRTVFAGSIALALAALSAPGVSAQGVIGRPTGGPVGPTVSPYLNLFRNGNSPAFNYYNLVRPQFQTIAGLQALQLGQARLESLPAGSLGDDVLITGRGAVFMNYGGYFQSAVGAANPVRLTPLAPNRPTIGGGAANRLPNPGPR